MTSVLLRPNGDNGTAEAALWTPSPAGTRVPRVNDANNSTYIIRGGTNPSDSSGGIKFDYATYTLGPTETVARYRLIVNVAQGFATSGNGTVDEIDNILVQGGIDKATVTKPGQGGFTTYGTAWVNGPLTQSDIDGLQSRHPVRHGTATDGGLSQIFDTAIELDVQPKPTVAVSNPQDQTAVDAKNAVLNWSTGGSAQTKARIKVYTLAQANTGGFDPETFANPIVDSQVLNLSTKSYALKQFVGTVIKPGQPPKELYTFLSNGTVYRAYVKIATDLNGVDNWSDWSAPWRFTTNFPPVVSAVSPTGGVTITSTTRPTFSWVYSDVDVEPQGGYDVRVYQRPGGAWPGGYSPDTTSDTPVWRDWQPTSSAQSTRIPFALLNSTNYRVYVQVTQLGRNSGLPALVSDWQYGEFNMSVAQPPAPTLTLQDQGDRVQVNVTPVLATSGTKGLTLPGVQLDLTTAPYAVLAPGGGWNTNDLDIAVELAPDTWVPTSEADIISCSFLIFGGVEWQFFLNSAGKLGFRYSTNGTSYSADILSTVATGFAAFARKAVRVTMDMNNGSGGCDIKFYTGNTVSTATTQLGTTITIGSPVTLANQSLSVVIGAADALGGGLWKGYVYKAIVYQSLTSTNKVVDVDFSAQTNGASSFTATTGGTVSMMNGAEIEYKESPNPDQYNIFRSEDGGVTWTDFVVAAGTRSIGLPKVFTPFFVQDFNVPYKQTLTYKVEAVSSASGDLVATPSSTAAIALTAKKVWIKDADDPSKNMTFPVQDSILQRKRNLQRTAHPRLGAKKPLVVRGEGDFDSFNLSLLVMGEAKRDQLNDLVEGGTLFIQTPKGSWFMEIDGPIDYQDFLWDDLHNEDDIWTAVIPLIEVEEG